MKKINLCVSKVNSLVVHLQGAIADCLEIDVFLKA